MMDEPVLQRRRTWRERLFTRPWRPWRSWRTIPREDWPVHDIDGPPMLRLTRGYRLFYELPDESEADHD